MLNKVIIMGRLTHDPELHTTDSNISFTNFSLAIDRGYSKDKDKKVTDFIDVVAWRATAEFACRNFTKGMLMAVVGRLQVRNWEDKSGNKRRSTEVVADEVFFCGDKKGDKSANGAKTESGAATTPSFPEGPVFPENLDDMLDLDGLDFE